VIDSDLEEFTLRLRALARQYQDRWYWDEATPLGFWLTLKEYPAPVVYQAFVDLARMSADPPTGFQIRERVEWLMAEAVRREEREAADLSRPALPAPEPPPGPLGAEAERLLAEEMAAGHSRGEACRRVCAWVADSLATADPVNGPVPVAWPEGWNWGRRGPGK
jgi:hypothetical protein